MAPPSETLKRLALKMVTALPVPLTHDIAHYQFILTAL
jgi:hypothetical protein